MLPPAMTLTLRSLDIFGGKGVVFTDLVKADKAAKTLSEQIS